MDRWCSTSLRHWRRESRFRSAPCTRQEIRWRFKLPTRRTGTPSLPLKGVFISLWTSGRRQRRSLHPEPKYFSIPHTSASLTPVLLADGFAAQHNGWMRLREPVINWLDVQARMAGGSCCVNLGVHMTFLPPHHGSEGSTVASELRQADCDIFFRLTWEDELDHWWSYDADELAADDLVACYEERGRPVFERYASFPQPFVDITPDTFDDTALHELLPLSKTGKILLLARLHDYLGNAQLAVRFSEMGLTVTPKFASGARFALKNILRKHGVPVPKGR